MDNKTAWTIFFANLVAMERHPGNMRGDLQPLSLKQLGYLADAMLGELTCRDFGQQQHPPSSAEHQASSETSSAQATSLLPTLLTQLRHKLTDSSKHNRPDSNACSKTNK